jgi:hypothetical protein
LGGKGDKEIFGGGGGGSWERTNRMGWDAGPGGMFSLIGELGVGCVRFGWNVGIWHVWTAVFGRGLYCLAMARRDT